MGSKFRCSVLLLACLVSSVMATEAPRPIRVLIVDGFSNHDWRLTTRSIRAILEPTGLFSVDVSTSPPDASVTRLGAVAAGLRRVRRRHPDLQRHQWRSIVAAARAGGVREVRAPRRRRVRLAFRQQCIRGLAGLQRHHRHRLAQEGIRLGAGRVGRRQDHEDSTGRRREYEPRQAIRRPRPAIAANIPSTVACHAPGSRRTSRCTTTSAVPRKMSMCSPTRANLTPDSTGLSNGRCATAAAASTHRLSGHVWRGDVQPVTVRDAGVQTLLVRALQWLAKRPVTWPVPADFPTATSTSVRAELRYP